MKKLSANRRPFEMALHYRRPLCALRMPLLSIGPREHAAFVTWETYPDARSKTGIGHERVRTELHSRSRRHPIAEIADAPLLDYVVSRCVHCSDHSGGYTINSVSLTLDEIATHLNILATAQEGIVSGLRRLTNTLVTLQRGGRRRYPPKFRLLDIDRAKDGTFDILLSDWLEDELAPPSANPLVTMAPRGSSELTGIRHRLYGWMLGFVGRGDRHERVIWLSEILERLGPLPDSSVPPWDQVAEIVTFNDLPDFDIELTTDRGDPAIRMRRRPSAPTSRSYAAVGNPEHGDGLIIYLDESPGTDAPSQQRTIEL